MAVVVTGRSGTKQLAIQKLQEKCLKEKEKITQDIMVSGLWQTEIQMTEGFKKLRLELMLIDLKQ